jgi:hypothetical protein
MMRFEMAEAAKAREQGEERGIHDLLLYRCGSYPVGMDLCLQVLLQAL